MNKIISLRPRKFYLLVIGFIVLSLVLGIAASSNLDLAQAAPQSAAVGIGAGSYNTTIPAGAAGPNGTPKRTANVTGPMPTNDWWSSLGWQTSTNAYSNNMIPNPLGMRAKANGLGIGYTPTASGGSYPYSEALTLGTVGLNSPDTKVDAFSDWTVTGYWSGGGSTLRATFGHGLPFVYATKTGGNALITFNGTPTIWSNSGNAVGATVGSRHFGIFAPTGATWTASGNTVQSTLAGKNYFSVAVLPDNSVSTLNDFKAHAFAFITDSRVSWSYNQSAAQLTTTFTATTTPQEGTEARPLMALYRHHWLYSSDVNTTYTYNSARGQMKVTRGNTFRTVMAFNGALPSLPDMGTYNRTTLYNYVNEVYTSQGEITSDTYWAGKALNRVSLLVWIADQVGHTAARDKFLSILKNSLQNWLSAPNGETSRMFYYDSTWGTLIGYPAAYGSNTDLNDHHFHYGYFVLAAATVANYDPAWASDSQWGGMVKLLIRDFNSWQRNDSMFPFLRNFDPYEGHGWASGNAFFGAGNNQESSSEAMMSNTGILLWGAVTGDTTIRDLGIFLFANELAAIEQYWMDIDDVVFPPSYNHVAAGMVWSDGVAHGTWFSGAPEMIHGINFLPIIGSSLYLGRRPSYVATNYNEIVAENGGVENEWVDIIWEYQALNDPAAAISKFGNGSYGPEAGESKAHTYHWIHNLNAMGRVDTTITANIPTYAVLNKNGTRTYVAWNPGSSSITVSFSNGVNCNVAARQLFASTTCSGTPPPTTPPVTTPPPTTPPPTTPPPTTPPPTTPPPGTNLALSRPVTCSSVENAGTACANAVDGNNGTRWASAFSDPQWIYVDLGATYTINRVVLLWEAAYGRSYQIQTSTNAGTWTTIYSTTTGDGGTDDLAVSGSGRYVRMNGTVRATGYGYSLWEFQVYSGGTPSPTTPPPTTPPPTTPPPTTPPAGQAPYGGTPWPVPGTIQAEDYDTGGEGVAYHDTTAGNSGGVYRSDGVDIQATTDTGGGNNVGWTAAGEWLEYTINVATSGTYTLSARVAAPSAGGSIHMEIDGANVTGAVAIPSTGGWQTWTTVTRTGIALTAGQHVMRIALDAAGFNLNWVSLTGGSTPPPTTPPPTTPPPVSNLALNRPVTCSSVESAGMACANAVDGNTGTRWASAFSDPQWIYVDLGATRTLTSVTLRWEAAYGRAFQIQVSGNASTWTTLYSTSTGTGGVQTIPVSGSGRYVRVYGTTRATQYGYSLWEFEVYGSGG